MNPSLEVTSGGVTYTGIAQLSAVEIVGCGQAATMRHSLHFEKVPGNGSYVRGVSVHASNAVGIMVKSTPGLEISGAVVHTSTVGARIGQW